MQVTVGIITTLAILGAMFALMVALNVFDRKQKQLIDALEKRYFSSPENQKQAELRQGKSNKETQK